VLFRSERFDEVPDDINVNDYQSVKSVLDTTIGEAIEEIGYEINDDEEWKRDDIRTIIMIITCTIASVAQFHHFFIKKSRNLNGYCLISYFFFLLLFFIKENMDANFNKDAVWETWPRENPDIPALLFSSRMPIGDDTYKLIVQFKNSKSEVAIGNMYVGKYFTQKGEFDKVGFVEDVKTHMKRFEQKKYTTFEYNHKSD